MIKFPNYATKISLQFSLWVGVIIVIVVILMTVKGGNSGLGYSSEVERALTMNKALDSIPSTARRKRLKRNLVAILSSSSLSFTFKQRMVGQSILI